MYFVYSEPNNSMERMPFESGSISVAEDSQRAVTEKPNLQCHSPIEGT